MFKNLDIYWDVQNHPLGENVIDLAYLIQHFDNGLEKDIWAIFIRFGNNTNLGGMVNVIGDTHGKTMS